MVTIDELVLIPIALFVVATFLPELLVPSIIIAIVGGTVYVAAKYYLIYPSLQEGGTVSYDIIGMSGKVVTTVTSTSGTVKVGSEIWTARCDEDELPTGSLVVVVERDGFTVKVKAAEP